MKKMDNGRFNSLGFPRLKRHDKYTILIDFCRDLELIMKKNKKQDNFWHIILIYIINILMFLYSRSTRDFFRFASSITKYKHNSKSKLVCIYIYGPACLT